MSECFHCGEALKNDWTLVAQIEGTDRLMCCIGCKTVAETLANANLQQYYQLRDQNMAKRAALIATADFSFYDDPAFSQQFVTQNTEGDKHALFIVDPMDCPACSWVVEKRLASLKGIKKIQIDAVSGRLELTWSEILLSEIAASLGKIGYAMNPERPNSLLTHARQALKTAGFHCFVAILFAMQTMMLTIPTYLADTEAVSEDVFVLLQVGAMIFSFLSLIIVARGWIIHALSDIRRLSLTMNLSVSFAILSLFFASTLAFWRYGKYFYFDSVSMFIAFVAISKWVHAKLAYSIETIRAQIIQQKLALVWRYESDFVTKNYVSADVLQAGDRIFFDRYDELIGDGILVSGETLVDEKMLTGEGLPVHKKAGDRLLAGCYNLGVAVDVEIVRVEGQSWVEEIRRKMSGIFQQKLVIVDKADRLARYLLPAIVMLSLMTFLGWYRINPSQAWLSALSVFVVVCPCALALSIPLALSAAQAALLKRGIVLNHLHVLEKLPAITDIAFDKTGTLTTGELSLLFIKKAGNWGEDKILSLARQMSRYAIHPVAVILKKQRDDLVGLFDVEDICQHWGNGVEATYRDIEGKAQKVRLGAYDFVSAIFDQDAAPDGGDSTEPLLSNDRSYQENSLKTDQGICEQKNFSDQTDDAHYLIYLGCPSGLLGVLCFQDQIRTGCEKMLLANRDKAYHLISGDHQPSVNALADRLGIQERQGRLLPADKLALLQQWQQTGKIIMMVGDGINDALVLAASDISLSFAQGAALSKAQADILLTDGDLTAITDLFSVAKKTMLIIRQNILWAIAYNSVMLPLAIMGWVTPWIAGIGMAISSMIVCVNSARLLKEAAWRHSYS